jgi:hydroxymethylpyrimidine pyrophosphatase-like HAD family hydrolase
MTIIFDVDGTLTKRQKLWAEPDEEMIAHCKRLIAEGHNVIIWTSTRRYAKAFCEKYDIKPLLAVGKPDLIVDNQDRKWGNRLKDRTITPEEFKRRENERLHKV